MNNVYVKENSTGFSIYFIILPNETLKWNYTVR